MNKSEISSEALKNQKEFYDERYKTGYMKDFSGLYETLRVFSVQEILEKIKKNKFNSKIILDYGCGEGRYIPVVKNQFPEASIWGSDISDIGIEIAQKNYPNAHYIAMSDEKVNLPDQFCDFLISIEVLEHVGNVHKSVEEIGRLLKPGGLVLLTTPCANKYSLEWFINKFNSGLQPSFDGYGRFATDEPGHLRRLNDRHIRLLFSDVGIEICQIYHRTHFFTTLVQFWGGFIKPLPLKRFHGKFKLLLASLDWHWLKFLPNGANMVVLGKKV